MAQLLLENANKPIPHSPIFDMESFFYVFLYVILSRKKLGEQFSQRENQLWEDLVPSDFASKRAYKNDANGKNRILSDLQGEFTCKQLEETCIGPFLPMLKEMGTKISYNYGRAGFYMSRGLSSRFEARDEDDLVAFFISVFQKAYDEACKEASQQE